MVTIDVYIIVKFDKIIMNPPYDKNLHLKILAKVITYLKDENSVCVNLSPANYTVSLHCYTGWNEKEKYVDNALNHCYNFEIFGHRESNDLFGLGNQIGCLAIYVCKNTPQNKYAIEKFYSNGVVETYVKMRSKFKKNIRTSFNFHIKDKKYVKSENDVKIFRMHDGGKTCYENLICENGNAVEGIRFNSLAEKNNFLNSIKTSLYDFMGISCNDSNPAHLPWMGDAINPRTGLKGYKSEWTDEDFYAYFNITKDEQKVIEETIRI